MSLVKPLVTYHAIAQAAERLQGIAHHTPVFTSRQADAEADSTVFFKCENFQRAGAFKFRGAYNAIACLSNESRRQGVVTFSSGNHAQALALAGQLLGVAITVVMPQDAPAQKMLATRHYGAEVILYDRYQQDREAIAATLMQQRGLTLIPPFNHSDVIAGQGTATKELLEAVGPLDYLVVPVGGGGLIAGAALVAAHLSPGCQVIGVEPAAGNDGQQSFLSDKIITIAPPQTIADGAQTQCLGELTFAIIRKHVHAMVTVTDEQLRQQQQFFAERMKMVVEPTGCLAAAAVLNRLVPTRTKRVGVIVSGGNGLIT